MDALTYLITRHTSIDYRSLRYMRMRAVLSIAQNIIRELEEVRKLEHGAWSK